MSGSEKEILSYNLNDRLLERPNWSFWQLISRNYSKMFEEESQVENLYISVYVSALCSKYDMPGQRADQNSET